jgi:hypothetical protein
MQLEDIRLESFILRDETLRCGLEIFISTAKLRGSKDDCAAYSCGCRDKNIQQNKKL